MSFSTTLCINNISPPYIYLSFISDLMDMTEPEVTIKEEIIDSDYEDFLNPEPLDNFEPVRRNVLPNPISLQPRITFSQNIHQKPSHSQVSHTTQRNLRNINGPASSQSRGQMEGTFLRFKGYRYYRDGLNFDKKTQMQKVYWRCCAYKRNKCKARLHTDLSNFVIREGVPHLNNCKDMYPRQV